MTVKKKAAEANATGMNKKASSPKTESRVEKIPASKKAPAVSRSTRKSTDAGKPATQVGKAAKKAVNDAVSEKKATVAMKPGPTKRSKSGRVITAQERWRMISENAYYRAERRAFSGGNPADDWAAAEAEIDAELTRSNTIVEP